MKIILTKVCPSHPPFLSYTSYSNRSWHLLLFLGIDFVQEKVLGQGAQDNESAIEQAKDEQISDFIRGQYKSTTGSDVPIKDKETRFG